MRTSALLLIAAVLACGEPAAPSTAEPVYDRGCCRVVTFPLAIGAPPDSWLPCAAAGGTTILERRDCPCRAGNDSVAYFPPSAEALP